jgi:Lar family restriction alleviation protein
MKASEGQELLPCPFCGEAPELHAFDGVAAVICTLDACRVEGPVKDTKEEAITAWNTRTGSSEGKVNEI